MRYQTADLIGYDYVRNSRGDPVPLEHVPDHHRLAGFVRGLEKHVEQALRSEIAADWVPERETDGYGIGRGRPDW